MKELYTLDWVNEHILIVEGWGIGAGSFSVTGSAVCGGALQPTSWSGLNQVGIKAFPMQYHPHS